MIDYIPLESSPRSDLLRIMNDERVRRHLIGGERFTTESLEAWIEVKSRMDEDPSCRIRGVRVHGEYAGWCGIQREEDGTYGLGIILDPEYWGCGPAIFEDMVQWSRELGHREVFVHLLDSRPVSRFLSKRMNADCETVLMLGRTFRRYRLSLGGSG